jgi:predicted methyltransferase
MKNLLFAGLGISALLITGCSDATLPDTNTDADVAKTEATTEMAGAPEKMASAEDIGNRGEVMMAIQNLDRSAKDKEEDDIRKAAGVLQFTGVWPGMTVLELEAGGGYYSEILSYIVGPEGKVISQNPAGFDAFLKPEDVEARYGADGKRLTNLEHHKSNFDDLSYVADNSVDMVTWFLGPHELFYTPEDGVSLGDVDKSYAEIFRVLKPGGKFIALDHKTTPGAPETSGNTTHRIDPDTVKARATNAGLVFKKASNVLANGSDDYNKNVFDPSVRRKTDRFLHMYVKPE